MVEMSLSEMLDMHGSGTVYHVDGRNPAVKVGSLSHYLQGFIYARWYRISSINSGFKHICTDVLEREQKSNLKSHIVGRTLGYIGDS